MPKGSYSETHRLKETHASITSRSSSSRIAKLQDGHFYVGKQQGVVKSSQRLKEQGRKVAVLYCRSTLQMQSETLSDKRV